MTQATNGNAAKMTLEERIVQKLKSDTLMQLVGDEDAITELTRRAIHEALYQPRRSHDGYRGINEDSPAVRAARDVAKAAAEQLSEDLIADLKADADFIREFRAAMVTAMPGIIAEAFRKTVQMEAETVASVEVENLAARIRNGMV